jgi:hypothetical protein
MRRYSIAIHVGLCALTKYFVNAKEKPSCRLEKPERSTHEELRLLASGLKRTDANETLSPMTRVNEACLKLASGPEFGKRLLTAALYRSFGEPTVSTTGRDGHFGRVAEE